ncbi:MAG: putative toxin-antitoxin system toxin component, PIN family, partial [Coriobacteriia bacterium]|nr:putative toxin-antitoxin system toxin component, PIN family [Coriobacteriia bacterium]
MRLVLDTNVLVSAYGFGGKPGVLFRRILEGDASLLTSRALLAGLDDKLYEVLGFDDEHVEAVIRQLARVGEVVECERRLRVIPDDADNRVLECDIRPSGGDRL